MFLAPFVALATCEGPESDELHVMRLHRREMLEPTPALRARPRRPTGSTSASSRALAMDGTCTGEHGVGLHKMDFLRDEYGADALDLMARIKRAFDPLNIMNPGKIVRV